MKGTGDLTQRVAKYFSLFHSVQTSSSVHLPGLLFIECRRKFHWSVKRPDPETDHSSRSGAEVKNALSYHLQSSIFLYVSAFKQIQRQFSFLNQNIHYSVHKRRLSTSSWAFWIQSAPTQLFSVRHILIPSSPHTSFASTAICLHRVHRDKFSFAFPCS